MLQTLKQAGSFTHDTQTEPERAIAIRFFEKVVRELGCAEAAVCKAGEIPAELVGRIWGLSGESRLLRNELEQRIAARCVDGGALTLEGWMCSLSQLKGSDEVRGILSQG